MPTDQNIKHDENYLPCLATEHPYYCSDSNYYSNDPSKTWETMTDFLAEFEEADIDMNLVFRWDVKHHDEDNPGRYYAEVFIIHQRKGLFAPHHIKNINEEESARFAKYLKRHWEVLQKIWIPICEIPDYAEDEKNALL